EQAAQGEGTAVESSFAQAQAHVRATVSGSRATLRSAGAQEQARLDAWFATAQTQATQGFGQRQQRAQQTGTTKGDEVVSSANDAAERTGGEIGSYADQARATGERKAASPGGSPDAAQARAEAARKLGGDTAADISRSL